MVKENPEEEISKSSLNEVIDLGIIFQLPITEQPQFMEDVEQLAIKSNKTTAELLAYLHRCYNAPSKETSPSSKETSLKAKLYDFCELEGNKPMVTSQMGGNRNDSDSQSQKQVGNNPPANQELQIEILLLIKKLVRKLKDAGLLGS